jgi:hypothetical protein
MSAVLLVYGLLTGKNAPVWLGFPLCISFVIGAAYRMRTESSRNYAELEGRMLKERAEFIEVINERDNQLQRATDRLAELEQAQLRDGPFVRVEWIWLTDGLSNFWRVDPMPSRKYRTGAADTCYRSPIWRLSRHQPKPVPTQFS